MEINRFIDNEYHANCYVIDLENTAVIIDPCVPYNTIKKYIDNKKVPYIFITHGHIDHFSHLDELKKITNAKIVCHYNTKEKIEDANKNCSSLFNKSISFIFPDNDYIFINENIIINIENKQIKNIYTPGHSSCSVCFILDNNMFSGDTLFKNSIGRFDLYSSNSRDMVKSINKIKLLKTNYNIYPGHDDITTLEEELINNRYLKKKV